MDSDYLNAVLIDFGSERMVFGKLFLSKDILPFETKFQNIWGYCNQISENKAMPFFNTFYHESKTKSVCKFGAWPHSVF